MDKTLKIVKVVDTTQFGKRFVVDRLLVEAPNGAQTEFFVRKANDFSIVIPETDDQQLVLVEQYRVGAQKLSLEFPMGQVPNSSPLDTAKTELQEETGYTAEEFIPLASFFPAPGWSMQQAHVFIAKGLTQGKAHPEPFEYIETKIVSKDELTHLIETHQIYDSATIVAAHFYFSSGKTAENIR